MVLTFDGTFDGFLSVVYAVYYEKLEPASIQIDGREQLSLGDLRRIERDGEKAARVFGAIRKKISPEAALRVYYASMSADENRFLPILRYIQLGFAVGHMVDSHLHEKFVRDVHEFHKNVGREAHLLHGFCRFAETKQGVFYCPVTPKNDVLVLLVEHFIERLMNQAWIIHDKRRKKAAIYDGKSHVIAEVPADAAFTYADGEEETQELWVEFFNALAIKERKNKKLQRQLLPLYFRGNMTEFIK
ncbi:MAG: TIGR03915 family putative DNA repair protein [Defluviitaleaceae bacterium]|nr:TIGR03915 family putative DNA repair protein [Defluviitaleaceae bacterium]